MKLSPIAVLVSLFLSATFVLAVEEPAQYEQRHELHRVMSHPPHSPLRFTLANGKERQSLEVKYVDAMTISFRIEKSGTCSRNERGKATIAEKWWLGAETDENEAGEAVNVQEYVYEKDKQCTIYIRIDEATWSQATIQEAADCCRICMTSTDTMHLKGMVPIPSHTLPSRPRHH
ncbi:hypothetical protein [Geomonas agri]|uniref:hypothetical protein n=1 Tax=Geomonas agri TaxID=2873702 RepID=UPI001CD3077F|nr:hypothetical protein [Geomonas agri]